MNNSGALVQRMEDEEVQSKMNEDEDQPVQRKEEDEDVQPSLYKRPANIQLQEEEDIQPKVSQLARKDRVRRLFPPHSNIVYIVIKAVAVPWIAIQGNSWKHALMPTSPV
ncbi:MAG: hypothetical protein WKG06_15980 [Segetibacter sp.]